VGKTATLSNLKLGTLEIKLDEPGRPDPAAAMPWEGMSGALVWVAGCVVGVVQANHSREGLGRLTAVRLDRYLRAGTNRVTLAALLNLPADGGLVDVTATAGPAVKQKRLRTGLVAASIIALAGSLGWVALHHADKPATPTPAIAVDPLGTPLPVTSSIHHALPSTRPAGTPSESRKAGSGGEASPLTSPSASLTSPSAPQPIEAAQGQCEKDAVVHPNEGISLNTCTAGIGYTDLTYDSRGLRRSEAVQTRYAGKNGRTPQTGYETCNGPFANPTWSEAADPIATAACLKTAERIAYVDVNLSTANSVTIIHVHVLSWPLR
jgi:hypothetical protein